MKLYKSEALYFLFNLKTKKIYIGGTTRNMNNNIFWVVPYSINLEIFSLEEPKFFVWKTINFGETLDLRQIQFQKALLERFE